MTYIACVLPLRDGSPRDKNESLTISPSVLEKEEMLHWTVRSAFVALLVLARAQGDGCVLRSGSASVPCRLAAFGSFIEDGEVLLGMDQSREWTLCGGEKLHPTAEVAITGRGACSNHRKVCP